MNLEASILQYRIILTPDVETGTGRLGYSAFCPTLGVADDGDTVEEALANVKDAIEVYLESLAEDGQTIPIDDPSRDIVTITEVASPRRLQLA